MRSCVVLALTMLAGCSAGTAPPAPECEVSLVVLGVAQDGGKPQIGNPDDLAWHEPSLRRLATSIAVVDGRGEPRRWLFDATPDLKAQLQELDRSDPVRRRIGIDGIFLTHAHIGHYTGLMLLGHESAGARGVPVFAMPGMRTFLTNNGPWQQLVRYQNISLRPLTDGQTVALTDGLSVTPFLVPHRQEYSEVVGFRIEGPSRSAVFLPDIDSWDEWDAEGTPIEEVIRSVDLALLDATFFADGEIAGRDMSGFPHPFLSASMRRFETLAPAEKAKIRFIHLNHTNPALDPASDTHREVLDKGFAIAARGERHCL